MEKDSCVICLDDLDEDIKYLRCIHAFHTNCINEWERQKSECPICKTPIYENKTVSQPQVNAGMFMTGASLAIMMGISHHFGNVRYNPYAHFVNILTREFTRDIIRSNYLTFDGEEKESKIEERPSNKLLEKALLLRHKLERSGVDLSDIDLDTLSPEYSRESIGFTYIKLLEKKDELR